MNEPVPTPARLMARMPDHPESQFRRFHARHPEVLDELTHVLRRWHQMRPGRPYSIWAAFQIVRWERAIAGLPDPMETFKLNNNTTGFYARLLRHRHPDLEAVLAVRHGRYVDRFDPMTVTP
jgi:hypothetical protein